MAGFGVISIHVTISTYLQDHKELMANNLHDFIRIVQTIHIRI